MCLCPARAVRPCLLYTSILVLSAKDGVQAQTRILFHALRKMNIPTVIFINKIDQAGVDLSLIHIWGSGSQSG